LRWDDFYGDIFEMGAWAEKLEDGLDVDIFAGNISQNSAGEKEIKRISLRILLVFLRKPACEYFMHRITYC
jgi:hypothetical protein